MRKGHPYTHPVKLRRVRYVSFSAHVSVLNREERTCGCISHIEPENECKYDRYYLSRSVKIVQFWNEYLIRGIHVAFLFLQCMIYSVFVFFL